MYKLDLIKAGGLRLDDPGPNESRRIAFYYQDKVNTKAAPYITSVSKELVVMIKNIHVRIW